MKLAIIQTPPESFFMARLINIITNKTFYRCGFVDESDGTFFDMCWKPKKSDFLKQIELRHVEFFDVPILTRADCEVFLKQDLENVGDFSNYVVFIIQCVRYLLSDAGKTSSGIIYTEKCIQWLRRKGYMPPVQPFPISDNLLKWIKSALQKTQIQHHAI